MVDAGFGAGAHNDTSGVTTLLARLTALRAGNLDNLDALISSRPTAQQIEDEILNALTSAHVDAGSVGLTIRQIRDAAIAGSTLDSLLDKIRGATTGQLFAAAAGMSLTEYLDSFRVINNKGDTDFDSGDNAANTPLWVELFSGAEVIRRPKLITLNVGRVVAVAGNSLLIGSGAIGAEVEIYRLVTEQTQLDRIIVIPISSVASGVRIAARTELSDGDGVADAAILRVQGAVLFG